MVDDCDSAREWSTPLYRTLVRATYPKTPRTVKNGGPKRPYFSDRPLTGAPGRLFFRIGEHIRTQGARRRSQALRSAAAREVLAGTMITRSIRSIGFIALALAGSGIQALGAQVVRIPIEGTIDKGLVPFVQRSLEEAGNSGARLAILDINTPGGRIDAAWSIVDAIQESPVPVYAFVDRGLSAGAMIALAAEDIFMRPGGSIGAATPVTGGGEKATEKIISAMRSEFRALAEARGIDPQLAAAMVDEEIEIAGVVEAGKLLTLSAEEAVQLGFASAVIDDLEGVLAAVDLPGAEVVTTQPNWAELIVRFLTSPVVAPLLLSLGFIGLLFP